MARPVPLSGREMIFLGLLLALMVPFQAILTPLFLELQALHLTNSLPGLVIVYTTFNLPFGVFIMRNAFEKIPSEIEDCARVDGASSVRILLNVFRPLVMPGVATTALYSVLFSWTEFLAALTFLTSPSNFTLPVALLNIETGTYGAINYGLLEAGAVVAMVLPSSCICSSSGTTWQDSWLVPSRARGGNVGVCCWGPFSRGVTSRGARNGLAPSCRRRGHGSWRPAVVELKVLLKSRLVALRK